MKLRRRKCKQCREWFQPFNSFQRVCATPACALAEARAERDRQERRELKRRKEAVKTRQEHLADLQKAFNAYIRQRDFGRPCISCNRKTGAKMNAGHYRAVGRGGGSPLRFNEINVHLQCEHCNSWNSGNAVEYRINLVRRIGPALVEWLERDHPPLKLSVEQIKALTGYYRQATKLLLEVPHGEEPF
jgi:hypothetical protein